MPGIKKILLFIFLSLGLFLFREIEAGTGDNVSGWAWSENIGWLSFNCNNPELPTPRCTNNYGVNINTTTGVFSGYAWSENIGWITFQESELSGCPTAPCQAKLDLGTKKISGWARALTDGGGWDGWIKLRKDPDYGVSWNSSTGEMEGWAWADQVIGWLSFNCKNQNVCGTSNYKVVYGVVDVTSPTVSVTGAPAGWQNTDATANVSCSDTGTGCDTASYKLKTYTSSGDCSTTYSDYTLTSPQTISSHLWVCAAAKDLAGNASSSPTRVEFKVDKDAPSTKVTAPAAGSWHKDDFTVTIDDSDTGGSGLTTNCQYLIVGLNPDPAGTDCSSGILSRSCDPVYKNVPVGSGNCSANNICIFQGENKCKVSTKSFDNAGNDSGWNSRNFSIDWTPPTIGKIACAVPPTACNPGPAVYCASAKQGVGETFCASTTDSVGKITGCKLYVDNQETTATTNISPIPCENGSSCAVSANYTFTTSGNHTMKFYCWDGATNSAFGQSITVNVEANHSPTITSGPSYTTSPCAAPTTQSGCNVNFTISAADSDGDTLTYNWNFGDGQTSTEQNPSHHYSTANTYTVTVTVSDGRGGTASGSLNITVSSPTLSVDVCAGLDAALSCYSDSAAFSKPANNVDLKGVVSGTMFGTINYKFDCTNDGTWDLTVSNQTAETYTAADLCNYPDLGTYTAKVFIERGTGSAQDTVSISIVENQPPVCKINVPKTGVKNQLIEIGVADSSDPDGSISSVKFCSDKNAANPNGKCDETWTKEYGWNTPEGDWLNATSKIMKWNFAETGTYEVWANVKDNLSLTAACFANITIYTPEEPITCSSATDCSNYYDGGCGYQGICHCGSLEKPVWSCSGGKCQCTCQYDSSCEAAVPPGDQPPPPPQCIRNYPDVVLSPSLGKGTAGQQLSYTVSVINNDSNCPSSNFSLTKSCPTGWTCFLDSTNLTIPSGQSKLTTLKVTSASTAAKGNYQISVTAQNSGTGLEKYSRTGYAIYEVSNNTPAAAISCDAADCGSGSSCGTNWIAYNRNCSFYLLNQSTDLDSTNPPANNNDITKSIWSIFYQNGTAWQDPYLTCSNDPATPQNEAICNLLLPSLPASKYYYAKLKVEDKAGATNTVQSKNFYIRQEAISEFKCSLKSTGGWQNCANFKVSEGVVVYFKDISSPSEGASKINSWAWTFEDGTPASSNLKNPSASFKKVKVTSGKVNLMITDDVGRTDTTSEQLQITIPLPEWREVPPL